MGKDCITVSSSIITNVPLVSRKHRGYVMTRSICKISGDPYIPSYHEPKTFPKQTRGPVLDTVAKVLPETATSVTRGSEWSTGFSTSDLALCWWASERHDGSSTWGPLTLVKLLDWDLGSLLWSFPYLAGVGVLRNEPVYGRFLFLSFCSNKNQNENFNKVFKNVWHTGLCQTPKVSMTHLHNGIHIFETTWIDTQ